VDTIEVKTRNEELWFSFPSFSRRGGRKTLIANVSEAFFAAGVVNLYTPCLSPWQYPSS